MGIYFDTKLIIVHVIYFDFVAGLVSSALHLPIKDPLCGLQQFTFRFLLTPVCLHNLVYEGLLANRNTIQLESVLITLKSSKLTVFHIAEKLEEKSFPNVVVGCPSKRFGLWLVEAG